ncbi:MAG: glutaredoxin 3 [Gammaproteobacteria bacterium]|nr:glutaredoxin 3 [Gammaproteobacteria bacterium]
MANGPEVQMYAKPWCPYCAAARALLSKKHARVTEIDIGQFPERRAEMIARSGRHTVPQIFVGSTHVGGFDDLAAMERAGTLDALLQSGH